MLSSRLIVFREVSMIDNKKSDKGRYLQRQVDKDQAIRSSLRRLDAAGIDPIIPRFDCLIALNLSAPTISRMQRRNELPRFEEISPGRKGWRRATLLEVISGRRTWPKLETNGQSKDLIK